MSAVDTLPKYLLDTTARYEKQIAMRKRLWASGVSSPGADRAMPCVTSLWVWSV